MSSWARDHARRLIDQLAETTRVALADAPLVALEDLGYVVQLRPESGIVGGCTVSGSYQPGPPPTITIVESRSQGRLYFTGLHELGHRLVAADDPLQDAFAEQPDKDKKLEEDVCDAVAGELLLPDEIVDRYIGARGPTANAAISLFHDQKASREACCVRAAQRIAGPGHVMLLKDGIARFTATANTLYRVRRGTPQLDGDDTAAWATGGRGEGRVTYAQRRPEQPLLRRRRGRRRVRLRGARGECTGLVGGAQRRRRCEPQRVGPARGRRHRRGQLPALRDGLPGHGRALP